MAKETGPKTTINISISPADKKYLKTYAINHDTTVAQMIADYVRRLRDGEDHQKE